ncbi:hypothetical protein BJ508DRAFT_412789 [Ascobolus immersus RN42]|uniref:Uncharacterized protein n=1 Tax=Ascobolus immersus RN42 TaxID=1160509 RepID=A0A3N4IE44_ASCIM|nr:hypothetical protein BJ508DRAFT_412789 [Ascobolus immersus RN42]
MDAPTPTPTPRTTAFFLAGSLAAITLQLLIIFVLVGAIKALSQLHYTPAPAALVVEETEEEEKTGEVYVELEMPQGGMIKVVTKVAEEDREEGGWSRSVRMGELGYEQAILGDVFRGGNVVEEWYRSGKA